MKVREFRVFRLATVVLSVHFPSPYRLVRAAGVRNERSERQAAQTRRYGREEKGSETWMSG